MKKAGKVLVLTDLESISLIVAHVFLMFCLCRLNFIVCYFGGPDNLS